MKKNQKILIVIGILTVIAAVFISGCTKPIDKSCNSDSDCHLICVNSFNEYGCANKGVNDHLARCDPPRPVGECKCVNGKCEFFEKKSKDVTESQAIVIANSTEEAQEFLKLYLDANVSVRDISCREDITPPMTKCRVMPPQCYDNAWAVDFWVGDLCMTRARVTIVMSQSSSEILAKYPKLEYIKNPKHCGKDKDCVKTCCSNTILRPNCCYTYNFIHTSKNCSEVPCGGPGWVEKDKNKSCVDNECVPSPAGTKTMECASPCWAYYATYGDEYLEQCYGSFVGARRDYRVCNWDKIKFNILSATSKSYEFCIPQKQEYLNEVEGIDTGIKCYENSHGRIGCSENEYLCLITVDRGVNTMSFGELLCNLSLFDYVDEIIETHWE